MAVSPQAGERRRQVRLGLVLNGGVSLAVWIGGVTREIDNLRLAGAAERPTVDSTGVLYRRLLDILQEDVVVDVIAGASAGGINGILLGASVYLGQPLPDLRETWIGIGDFRTLLRPPRESNPPSLMMGDRILLTEMNRLLARLYENPLPADPPQLYLYVTTTDLFGFQRLYHDSTGRTFVESDSRRRLAFWSRPAATAISEPTSDAPAGTMRRVVSFADPDARQLLAAAARSTSSFPVAFEAHKLDFFEPTIDAAGQETPPRPRTRWLIDGGVLDNQPFNPVLDRISVIRTDRPVRRVIAYIVPYVNEPGTLDLETPEYATARQTMTAASTLPRDIPKLESLDRVTAESDAQTIAEDDRRRMWAQVLEDPGSLATAAQALFAAYRRTRYAAALAIWNAWAAPDFQPGEGVLGQDPSIDPRVVSGIFGATPPTGEVGEEDLDGATRWVPTDVNWNQGDDTWTWGLAPAERVAAWALLFLDDADSDGDLALELQAELNEARGTVSGIVESLRQTKTELLSAFRSETGELLERADRAYASIASGAVQAVLVELDRILDGLRNDGLGELPSVRQLLHLEVVRNAFATEDPRAPFPFTFVFMSAGIRNSLGHDARSPQQKLAGLKLGHFAGFLKRSWRANDWLWGRLDGVEHMLRAVIERDYLSKLAARQPAVVTQLADLAFPSDDTPAREIVDHAWPKGIAYHAQRPDSVDLAPLAGGGNPRAQFQALLGAALDHGTPEKVAAACLDCCRSALAARIQLVVLADDLERVATTAAEDLELGASKSAPSVFWAGKFFERDPQLGRGGRRRLSPRDRFDAFTTLTIGDEKPTDEADSNATIGVMAQLAGVASAMIAGDRSGLPLPVRSALATVRGVTLPLSGMARLAAREPWLGAVVASLLTGLVLWIALSQNALLGALFPALALIVVALWLVLFTIATSLFEANLSKPKRWVGFAFLLGVPLGFGILGGYPRIPVVRHWLDSHLTLPATRTAAVLALLAAAIALSRMLLGWKKLGIGPSWRRTTLGWYRPVTFVALLVLAGGFVAKRWFEQNEKKHNAWIAVADEHKGTILVAILLGLLFAAALLSELVIPAIDAARMRRWVAGRQSARR